MIGVMAAHILQLHGTPQSERVRPQWLSLLGGVRESRRVRLRPYRRIAERADRLTAPDSLGHWESEDFLGERPSAVTGHDLWAALNRWPDIEHITELANLHADVARAHGFAEFLRSWPDGTQLKGQARSGHQQARARGGIGLFRLTCPDSGRR